MFSSIKKLFAVFAMTACLCHAQGSASEDVGMTAVELKAFIQQAFKDVLENMNATEETYAKYFSKEYRQYVDNKTLTYKDFVDHMTAQKKALRSVTVSFRKMVAEGNQIATVHVAEGVKKDGKPVKAQINAVFTVKMENRQPKFVECDELSHLLVGEKADEDLGSRK